VLIYVTSISFYFAKFSFCCRSSDSLYLSIFLLARNLALYFKLRGLVLNL